MSELQPAFYVLESRRWWAKWINLLHAPYSMWHLSYAALGAVIAPHLELTLLGWTVLAFLLAMGVGAHAFDLLKGDPLRQQIPWWQLLVAGILSLWAAIYIGAWQMTIGAVPLWLLLALPLGVLFAVGYGKEWPGLHGDWQFATWWAVFPLLVAFFAQGIAWTWALVPAVVFAFLTAKAQRVLSTRVRLVRRRLGRVRGTMIIEEDGSWGEIPITKAWLIKADEAALALLSFAMPCVALGILLWRILGE